MRNGPPEALGQGGKRPVPLCLDVHWASVYQAWGHVDSNSLTLAQIPLKYLPVCWAHCV